VLYQLRVLHFFAAHSTAGMGLYASLIGFSSRRLKPP